MSYSIKISHDRPRFYCDNELIEPHKIPRLTYIELLSKYKVSCNYRLYFSVIPIELRELLLQHVDLDTLDLLTDEFNDFKAVANEKFWKKMLLLDVYRKLDESRSYNKNNYMYPMKFVREFHQKMRSVDHWKLDIRGIIKDSLLVPELLIEQLLTFYPEYWAQDLFHAFINYNTTIEFVENFIELAPNGTDKTYALIICLQKAFRVGNVDLAEKLHDKGVRFTTNFGTRHLYEEYRGKNQVPKRYYDLLIACDYMAIHNMISCIVEGYPFRNGQLALPQLIKYFISKGVDIRNLYNYESVNNYLQMWET